MKQIINCLLIILSLTNKFGISQKVTIIGKSLGGGLCSYFLHKTIPGIKIDIYNHQPTKVTFFTGILFNSHNVHMNDLVKEKNIQTADSSEYYRIKDGDEFYQSDIKNCAGSETFHAALKEYAMQQLEIFKQIYHFQKNGETFKTVRQLLKKLSPDFENYYTTETTESLLFIKNPIIAANLGIQKFIKNALACTFFNTNVHGFAGLALLMFSALIEEMQHIRPENINLFIKSLLHKDDRIFEKDISIIVRENNQNYIVPQGDSPKPYDFIILATTTAADVIQLKGFTDPVQIFKYRKTHISYMTGQLSKKFIKVSKNLIPIYNVQTKQFYMQIPYPNKIEFSITGIQPPSEPEILQYLKQYKIKKTNCTAYTLPDYSAKDDTSLRDAKFELAENLYNAQALHSLTINHEMLAIGAKNIALLIKNRIEEIGRFADEQNLIVITDGSSSAVGQTNNQVFDERSTNSDKVSSSSVLEHRTNQTIDKKISGGRASSSTVRQRTRQFQSRKSRANRKQ